MRRIQIHLDDTLHESLKARAHGDWIGMSELIRRAAGRYANRYRKAFEGVFLEDFLLAATALVHRCPLWTGKRKHYPMDDIELFAG